MLDRPTTHDEEWRYADADYLAAADVESLTRWTERTVAPGEMLAEHRLLLSGEIERLRVRVGQGARFELGLVNAGGPYSRFEAEVTLEEGAHFEFGGVLIGGGDKRQEFVTRVIHAEPGASSNQLVRSVQWSHATGNFLGRIDVARDAQQTDAAQNFKAILLERGASANAKPELEIYADDVKCAHGAAVGELDDQVAFYMAARGLPPSLARKLQVRAFIADAFAQLPDEQVRERLIEQALAQLPEDAL